MCGYAAAYVHSFFMLSCLSTQDNMQNEWTYAAA
jgi:hypothetical protein